MLANVVSEERCYTTLAAAIARADDDEENSAWPTLPDKAQ